MKAKRISFIIFYFINLCILTALGCGGPRLIESSKDMPDSIREYKRLILYGNRPGMVNTGIHLNSGDTYSILATGSVDLWRAEYGAPADFKYHDVGPEQGWPFMARIGMVEGWKSYFTPLRRRNGVTLKAFSTGNLYVGVRDGEVDSFGDPLNYSYYKDNGGFFKVDIIVWKTDNWIQISEFFKELAKRHPDNVAVAHAFHHANSYAEIMNASQQTSKEIEETKKEIDALKQEPVSKQAETPQATVKKDTAVDTKIPLADSLADERVAQLEEKLTRLTKTLAQLEEMKKKLEEERKKSSLLAKELEEKEKRELDLLAKLEGGSKTPPIIAIASPMGNDRVEVNKIILSGVAEDDQGLENLQIYINDEPLESKIGRGIKWPEQPHPKRIGFRESIPLQGGRNQIKILAVDSDGLSSENMITVHYVERRKNVWAVIIGINNYPNIRQLKYAVNDARMFYDYLVHHNHIPAENVTLLVDQTATLTKLRSVLGTHLKNMAGKDDMVIIFFAGHGAIEKEVMSPDGDGLEKYLLPYDADPKDLYATALPMGEISRIFKRIRSERLVFIADACYSGASGGRTIDIAGIRANISEAFLDRVAGGKGRVIMTASGANEVSAENDELKQGVFTYFLIEGLRGKADADGDGLITVDEVYRYVSDKVPQATGQEQHPVKKGTVEGRLILGIVN
jgi:hypothetical protein